MDSQNASEGKILNKIETSFLSCTILFLKTMKTAMPIGAAGAKN